MDADLVGAIADGYERWAATGDDSAIRELFAPDVYDNVSRKRGLDIFDLVGGWQDANFADRRIEHHATMTDGDRVLIWYSQHGRHVGNGFPRLAGRPVDGVDVAWKQVHVFRADHGKVVEHWAVRDDLGLLEQIDRAAG